MTTRLLSLAAVLPMLAWPQPEKSGVNLYSLGNEAQIGRTLAQQLRASLTIMDEPRVARIGALLAQHADTTFEYHFQVFDDAANPFAAPSLAFPHEPVRLSDEPLSLAGGWIFVPLSLVQRTSGDPQLAAILAHSMAHIALRHATHLASLDSLMKMSSIGMPDNLPAPVHAGQSLAMPVAMAQFARKAELQADAVALTTLTGAGYDSQALIDYIRTLPPEARLSSMPAPAVRVTRIEARQ